MTHIKYFEVFGERNSGTNYLRITGTSNFDLINYTNRFGHKHYYIKGLETDKISGNAFKSLNLKSIIEHQDTLFLIAIRDPYTWLQSMFYSPWDLIPDEYSNLSFNESRKRIETEGFDKFIRQKVSSYLNSEAIEHDKIETFENMVEMRNCKNEYWMELYRRVDNCKFIRLENFIDDLLSVIESYPIKSKNPYKVDLLNYRRPKTYPEVSAKSKKYIDSILNNELDNMFYK